jgi:hypothetical protein
VSSPCPLVQRSPLTIRNRLVHCITSSTSSSATAAKPTHLPILSPIHTMVFGNFWQHQNPPPYAPYGQQPVTANSFYNNATPEWVYNHVRCQWELVYKYQGIQAMAQRDQRVTNSWYANYGVEPRSGEAVTWDWVWDPRVNQWLQRPVGSQPYGTTRAYVPKKMMRDHKRYEREMRDYERQQRHQARRERDHQRQLERHQHKLKAAVRGDTHIHHLHTGNTYVVDSNQATYGSGNSGFKKFVRFLGLSSGS